MLLLVLLTASSGAAAVPFAAVPFAAAVLLRAAAAAVPSTPPSAASLTTPRAEDGLGGGRVGERFNRKPLSPPPLPVLGLVAPPVLPGLVTCVPAPAPVLLPLAASAAASLSRLSLSLLPCLLCRLENRFDRPPLAPDVRVERLPRDPKRLCSVPRLLGFCWGPVEGLALLPLVSAGWPLTSERLGGKALLLLGGGCGWLLLLALLARGGLRMSPQPPPQQLTAAVGGDASSPLTPAHHRVQDTGQGGHSVTQDTEVTEIRQVPVS